jgi:hypothetical protein
MEPLPTTLPPGGSTGRQRRCVILGLVRRDRAKLLVLLAYLNLGIGTGAVMWGAGSDAIRDALPTPLGSTITLFMPPAFAGPGGMPLIGTFPEPAAPATRGLANCANEAAGVPSISRTAKAIFSEVFDMVELHNFRRDIVSLKLI